MKNKILLITIFLFLVSLYLGLLFSEKDKINDLPDLTYNSREYNPPPKTKYNGFILSSPKTLLENKDKNRNLLDYFILTRKKDYSLKKYSIKDDRILINDSIVLKRRKIDYYDLPSEEGNIIRFKDGSLKIILQLSRYNDNAYIFDPEAGYVFLFKRDFLNLWTNEVYDI